MENGPDNYLKTDLMNVILREKKVVFHRVIHIDFQLDKIYLYILMDFPNVVSNIHHFDSTL